MRYIVQDDVYDYLPENWDKLVESAEKHVADKIQEAYEAGTISGQSKSEIDAACLKARHEAISQRASVWRHAELALARASHDKCWYCETKVERSDCPVDHFRPKNSVIESPGHPGYYWLAFNWKNFRYSCTYCNSFRSDKAGGTKGGKRDHFPIIPPPLHAQKNTDPTEFPVLLDPTNSEDTKLLTFLPNGYPHPTDDRPETILRVETSVKLYHLHQVALVRKRKQLASEIEEHVFSADIAKLGGDNVNYLVHKKAIIKKTRASADLTTAARIYLGAYRDRAWVAEIFDRHI